MPSHGLQEIDARLSVDTQHTQLSKLIDVAFELQAPYGELRPSDQRLTVCSFVIFIAASCSQLCTISAMYAGGKTTWLGVLPMHLCRGFSERLHTSPEHLSRSAMHKLSTDHPLQSAFG